MLVAATSTAKAHLVHKNRNETKLHYAKRLIWHGSTSLRWIKTHRRYILAEAGPSTYRIQVRDHRWELNYGLRMKRQELRRMYRPSHYSGWSCITNGAYVGAPHEGNGYNGSYTGPLGMTTPWMGYYPPGSDWVHSSVSAVYAIAEKVAARYSFSYSFMSHQWPNTFPPCSHYF